MPNSSLEFRASVAPTSATWMSWSLVLKVPYNRHSPTIPTHRLCSCVVQPLTPSSQRAWFQQIILYKIPFLQSLSQHLFVKCASSCSLKTRSHLMSLQFPDRVLQLRFSKPSSTVPKPVFEERTGASNTMAAFQNCSRQSMPQ